VRDPVLPKDTLSHPGSTPAAEPGKARKLGFFGSFEEKGGEVFFPLEEAPVDDGNQPDTRGPYHKTNDQGGSQSIHSFYLLDYLLHVACQEKFFFALKNCFLKTIISIIPADFFRARKRKREAFSLQPHLIFAHKN
jgi:hypothetical protein